MRKKIAIGKRIEGILGACLLFIFLTGCGEVPLQKGVNLELSQDGSVTVTYIEEFPADYYDAEELQQMNQEEVEEYNQKTGKPAVEIVSTEADGSQITLSMRYASMEDYEQMNGEVIYSGTVEQAQALGYDLTMPLYDVKTKEKADITDFENLSEHHIVITKSEATLHTYKKILYVTDNVTVAENGKSAEVSGDSTSVIIFR